MLVLRRNGSESMQKQNYKIPFFMSLAINTVFIGIVALSLHSMSDYTTKFNDVVIDIDMSKYEVPKEVAKKPQQEKQVDDTANGGKAGTILPDLSGKPTEGLKDLNPYLGGHEEANVNVIGDVGDKVGNPGVTDTPGEGGSNQFGTGTGTEGLGTADGTPATEPGHGGGSYDTSGYTARLESRKVLPKQAADRNLVGRVTFVVTFDENGNFVDASMTESSGYAVLDNAASRLVSSNGGIENSTGQVVTQVIIVDYR